jgi:hypothetical protein
MEQISFEFNKDGLKAFDRLNNILFTSGWNSLHLHEELIDEETKLLFSLLQHNVIKVFECIYEPKYNFPEEFMRNANLIACVLRKRNVHNALYNALDIFSNYAPDLSQTKNNALFFPDLKAFIRCGDLTPAKMFGLFEKADCKKIILFQDACISEKESAYYIFECTIPNQVLNDLLQKMQDKRMALMLKHIAACNEDVIPKLLPDAGIE